MTRISHIAERSVPWKRTLAISKSMAAPGMLARIRALVAPGGRAVVGLVAPMGYEDQTGFCYGPETVANPSRSRGEVRH